MNNKTVRTAVVLCEIFAIIAFLGARDVRAETVSITPQNTVTGPILDILKPLESFKTQLETKVPQIGSGVNVGGAKRLLDQNGITYEATTGFFNTIMSWVNERLAALNSPAFVMWAVDFIKRVFLLLLELVNKIVSYL